MTLTSASCTPVSTADSSSPDTPARPGAACAIRPQPSAGRCPLPNLFPRLTLAKLYAADLWIVLDDVQFARRDYQHRARLASLSDPCDRQWLTLATHLPHGRPTLILEARLAEPERCWRRVAQLVQQHTGVAGTGTRYRRPSRRSSTVPDHGPHGRHRRGIHPCPPRRTRLAWRGPAQ